MSDCACLWGDEGESPDFFHDKWVTARKTHRCHECREEIPAGHRYYRVTGKWDGEVRTYKTCAPCHDIRESLYCDSSYAYGTLWEDVTDQLFREGPLNSACLDKLATPEGKQLLARRWWAWVEDQSR